MVLLFLFFDVVYDKYKGGGAFSHSTGEIGRRRRSETAAADGSAVSCFYAFQTIWSRFANFFFTKVFDF